MARRGVINGASIGRIPVAGGAGPLPLLGRAPLLFDVRGRAGARRSGRGAVTLTIVARATLSRVGRVIEMGGRAGGALSVSARLGRISRLKGTVSIEMHVTAAIAWAAFRAAVAGRRVAVPAEAREIVVAAERREIVVRTDPREVVVPREDRML